MTENIHHDDRDLKIFVGAYGHSESETKPLVTIRDGVIGVENGKIIFMDTQNNMNYLQKKYNFGNENICRLKNCEFFLPGFVDVYIHAPQYINSGLGGLGHENELRNCIKNNSVSSEIKFKNPSLTKACYMDTVQSTINYGTTTACYFGSIYSDSCEILASVTEELGQRAFIGKLCINICPSIQDLTTKNSSNYIALENTSDCLYTTEQFVKNILDRKNPLIKPFISPKSPLSCTEELLKGLGEIAKKYDIHIQSILSKSEEENNLILNLFPKYKNITEIYEKTGLLTPKSIMAYCLHLTDNEMKILKDNCTSVAHCPTSNILHDKGLCPVRKFKTLGIKIGLGTNVSRSFNTTMLQIIRHAILTSEIIRMNNLETKPFLIDDIFYMATLGGAEVLSMEKEIGNFEVGKSFDALRINISSIGSNFSILNRDTLKKQIHKFIMVGDEQNIIEVYIEGKNRKVNNYLHKNQFCKFL